MKIQCRHCLNDDVSMLEEMGTLKGERYLRCGICSKVTGVKLNDKNRTSDICSETVTEGIPETERERCD
jgi:hypothetical protein